MTKVDIKRGILRYRWEKTLQRPFGAFVLSLFRDLTGPRAMRIIGIDADYPAFLYERSYWYFSPDVHASTRQQLKRYLTNGGSIKKLSASCAKFYRQKKIRIQQLAYIKGDPIKRFQEIFEILSVVTRYIQITHPFEDLYTDLLKREVPKYVANSEEFIAAISFTRKKNAHALLEEAIQKGIPATKIAKEFGWIRSRDAFSEPFTVAEIKQQQKNTFQSPESKVVSPRIPRQLKFLIDEVQELIYFRTFRTDMFYELLFLSRPITTAVARHYGLQFKDLTNYSVPDLLSGKPALYPKNVTAAMYLGELAFFKRPILPDQKLTSTAIKGIPAYKGILRGRAKVVTLVEHLSKVKLGDILVTQMTFPSFIMAMKRAAAFITDEGGMTCHAAIVAREMKKPCIVGTKVATQVIKDGDKIEVDADKGVVRVL